MKEIEEIRKQYGPGRAIMLTSLGDIDVISQCLEHIKTLLARIDELEGAIKEWNYEISLTGDREEQSKADEELYSHIE